MDWLLWFFFPTFQIYSISWFYPLCALWLAHDPFKMILTSFRKSVACSQIGHFLDRGQKIVENVENWNEAFWMKQCAGNSICKAFQTQFISFFVDRICHQWKISITRLVSKPLQSRILQIIFHFHLHLFFFWKALWKPKCCGLQQQSQLLLLG